MEHKRIKRTHKRIEFGFIFGSLFTLLLCGFFTNGLRKFEHTGNNTFHIYLNGAYMGTVNDEEKAEHLLIESRRKVASESTSLMFMTSDLDIKGEEKLFGKVDSENRVKSNMQAELRKTVDESIQRTCTVKIEEYMITLSSVEDVRKLLQAALDLYDQSGRFELNFPIQTTETLTSLLPRLLIPIPEKKLLRKKNSNFPPAVYLSLLIPGACPR